MQHYFILFALKVSWSLYCLTSISHGVDNYFPGAVGYGHLRCYFFLLNIVMLVCFDVGSDK